MKTLLPTPDSMIPFSMKSAKVRLAEGLWRASLVCAGLGVLTGAAAAPAQQPVAQTVLVADFDHDGIPDTLVQSSAAPTATIAFGSVPYGSFGANAKLVTFPAACTVLRAGSLAIGDFNRDGFPDIAFFCGTTAGTMLGKGDGTFAAPVTLTGVATSSGIVGDFDHDGNLDIAVLSSEGTNQAIRFLSGKGDGTFNEPILSNLTVNSYSTMTAADLNADGFPDLLLINSPSDGPPSLDVLGNNKIGTFGTGNQGIYTASTTATVATGGSTSILVGSFFGMATTDVVVAGTGANGDLFAFKNTSSDTAYSFADPVTVPVAGLTAANAGRIVGSGFSDVAVSNGTNIFVLANDGSGNFSASYPQLTLASTASTFAVADANNDGYADLYIATLPAGGVLQIGVNLTAGSATATSQPFSLAIGNRAISAAWVGNVNFAGSSATGTQLVQGVASATMIASGKNPSNLGDAVTFSVHVAPAMGTTQTPTGTVVLTDGSAMLASGAIDGGGNFAYTTSALTQATHTIAATYSGDSFYAASTGTLMQVVNHGTIASVTSFTPSSAVLGSAATSITVTGTNFASDSVVQVNGAGISTTVVSSTTLMATIPASYFATAGTLAITVFDQASNTVSAPVNFTVTSAGPAAVLSVPPTSAPGTQPSLTLSLTQPYPVDITATVTLAFAASTTPAIDDPSIVFAATGDRTQSITIPAGTTTVPPIELQAGTVAGTITVPITLTADGKDVTPANLTPGIIVVPTVVPNISSATITRSGKQLTVVVHGFSNTREVANAKFHFTAATGATLGTTDLTILGETIFNAKWFQMAESDQYGSTFTYTQVFNLSDDATTVSSVDVTLTNAVGASETMTAK